MTSESRAQDPQYPKVALTPKVERPNGKAQVCPTASFARPALQLLLLPARREFTLNPKP